MARPCGPLRLVGAAGIRHTRSHPVRTPEERKGLRRQMLRRPTPQSNGTCYGPPPAWPRGALRLTDDAPRPSGRGHSVVSGDAPDRRRPADAVLSNPAGAIAARVKTGNHLAA